MKFSPTAGIVGHTNEGTSPIELKPFTEREDTERIEDRSKHDA